MIFEVIIAILIVAFLLTPLGQQLTQATLGVLVAGVLLFCLFGVVYIGIVSFS